MKIKHLYAEVTNKIIAELEAGAVPWTRPWKNGRTSGLMPQNAATGRSYSGINIPILWGAAAERGYATHAWATFKQALALNAAVRKGEAGTHIVFTRPLKLKDEDAEDGAKTISMLRAYVVFNVAQLDGFPEQPAIELAELERTDTAERFVQATKADIRHGGSSACFVPSRDFIAMPPAGAFRNAESFYATELHELGHWSGHDSRLNRDLSGRFGTRAYAAEELIAELTAAFLCAHLSITGELRHAGYIADWITLLKEDDRAIFTAASKASQAADYLRAFSKEAVPCSTD